MLCDQSKEFTSALKERKTIGQSKNPKLLAKKNRAMARRRLKRIEELSARQLLNPDAGAHLHHTQNSN